jgi:ATP-dependent Lon protease
MGQKIQNEARSEIDKVQREYYLREQLKAIQRELGEGDEQTAEIEEFRQKIESAGMPEEAEKQARRELDRLRRCRPQLQNTASSAPIWIGWSHFPGRRSPRITWTSLTLARCWTRTTTA